MLHVPLGIDPGWDYNPGMHQGKALADNEQRSKRTMDKVLAAPLPKPEFKPQKTTKAAAQWAVDANLVDFADYSGIKPEVANAWNESLWEHLQEFPALRHNQEFTGTIQAQNQRYYQQQIERYIDDAVAGGIPQYLAEQAAKFYVKPIPPVRRKTAASSWSEPGVKGIAINRTWGKDPGYLKAAAQYNVDIKHHPEGCGTIRALVDHELGHQLDDLLGLHADPDVIKLFEQSRQQGMEQRVSSYAGKNIFEFIAEAWAEYRNNPTPRSTARTLGRIVQARYRSRFPAQSD